MKSEKSKIDGVGIVPLRCEICFGNITPGEGTIALLKDNALHFAHSSCYDDNESSYILEKMNEISNKTKNDQEMFDLMSNND